MSWNAVYRWSLVGFIVIAVIGVYCGFWPQIQRYKNYQHRKFALEESIAFESMQINNLKKKQERLRNDPRFVERIAHERGMAKPDEYLANFTNGTEPGSKVQDKD